MPKSDYSCTVKLTLLLFRIILNLYIVETLHFDIPVRIKCDELQTQSVLSPTNTIHNQANTNNKPISDTFA